MKRRSSRVVSQMNVVPYIDVMLVLLVIFMAAAPMLQPSNIEIPSVGQASNVPADPLQVGMRDTGSFTLLDLKTQQEQPAENISILIEKIQTQLQTTPNRPVLLAADKKLSYGKVMEVMDKLQAAKIERVGLMVNTEAGK